MLPSRIFMVRMDNMKVHSMFRNASVLSFSALYSTHFVFLGLLLPFFSGWLSVQGFSPSQIGLINGVALVARLGIGPIIAILVDRQKDKRIPLIVVSALFAIAGVLLVLAKATLIIAIASCLIIWCFGLLVPLTDTMVLRADRAGQLQYGPVRAVGSFAFLVTTILGGVLLDRIGISSVGAGLAGSCVAAFIMALLLPEPAEAGSAIRGALRWKDAVRLVSHPVFIIALFAAGLTQGAHAVYYAYSILHWSELGYSTVTIGWLWAIGVIAEIGLLAKARGIARKFSPHWLLAVGAFAALMRWSATALEPSLGILIFLQTMHAFTFAATYLGTIEFIDRAIPLRFINTGMVLFSTTGVGAITGFATVIAGYVYEAEGARPAYLLMALLGGGALILSFILGRVWDKEKIIG